MTTRLRLWLRAFFRHQSVDADLSREMQAHVGLATDQFISKGIDPVEARRRALVEFGGVEHFKEAVRDERGTRFLQDVGGDFRQAWRAIRRRPLFLLTVALTLGLGIGATTTVYSWTNWLLLRPVPGVINPGGVVSISFLQNSATNVGAAHPLFNDLRQRLTTLGGIAGYSDLSIQISGSDNPPANASGAVIVGDYFGLLGVRPLRGRFFLPAESDPASSERVVVISADYWRSAFGRAESVIGRHLTINAAEYRIVGIAGEHFAGVSRNDITTLWLPPSSYAQLRHARSLDVQQRAMRIIEHLIGRPRTGITAAAVEGEARRVVADLVREWPTDEGYGIYEEYLPVVDSDIGTPKNVRALVKQTTRNLAGIVALILLISVANTANLLLLRGTRRRAEFALRRAIGASNGRLLRLHLIEGTIFALTSGVVGILVALLLNTLMRDAVLFRAVPPASTFDRRVLVITLVTSLACGMLVGMAPVLVSHSRRLMSFLKDSSRATVTRQRLRATLTTIQLGASLALVIGALLLTTTLRNFARIELGFNPDQLMVYGIRADPQGYSLEQYYQFRQNLLAQVTANPGISTAAINSERPFGGGGFMSDIRLPADTGKNWSQRVMVRSVSPRYFDALQIKLLSGRTFTDDEYERKAGDVVIIGRLSANKLFRTENVVGQQIAQREGRTPRLQTIIGVADEVQTNQGTLRNTREATIYQPAVYDFFQDFTLVVRSPLTARQVDGIVQRIVTGLDPNLPAIQGRAMSQIVDASLGTVRLFARLIGLLAVIAALLASVGLYSVIAFGVTERTREIGIRMALGATPAQVIRLVLHRGVVLVVAGLAIGMVLSIATGKLIESQLFGVTRFDPAIYTSATVVTILLAVAASALPARTATRVTPMQALKTE